MIIKDAQKNGMFESLQYRFNIESEKETILRLGYLNIETCFSRNNRII